MEAAERLIQSASAILPGFRPGLLRVSSLVASPEPCVPGQLAPLLERHRADVLIVEALEVVYAPGSLGHPPAALNELLKVRRASSCACLARRASRKTVS